MQRSITYQVRDLSPEKRHAAEILLGEALAGDELITVRASKDLIIKEALSGQAREEAFDRLFERINRTASRAEGEPDELIDAAIDEACDYVRHHPE